MNPLNTNKPVVIGITGASGSIIGFQMVRELLQMGISVELIMTEKSFQVIFEELGYRVTGQSEEDKSRNLIDHLKLAPQKASLLQVFGNNRLDAPSSSGTHLTQGMVIIPCSMGTLGKVANGIGDNLVCRSADVTLKENRKLIIVPRETPLNQIHLKNMLTLSQAGALIVPPVLSFYLPDFNAPASNPMAGQINYIIGKCLDLLGLEHQLHPRWGEQAQPASESSFEPSSNASFSGDTSLPFSY